jgi:DNA (cytosine-5)-methyltransferase 1
MQKYNPQKLIAKRKALGLSTKQLSDALGFGKDGDKIIRGWESGEMVPDDGQYNMVMSFASDISFKTTDNPEFSFIDLFAGIGGIRIPFMELGGNCIFSSEWDKHAQTTYRINFGETPAGNIREIKTSDIPDFDILLGGFPCQPFSQAGLHKGFSDTRGTLFFEIERIIDEKKKSGHAPKAFLLENVKRLKGHDGGNTFKVIMEHLHALNYYATAKILRAGDFGVPQNRERIYIIGFDKDYYNIPDEYEFEYPIPPHTKTCFGNILEQNVDPKYTISEKLYMGHFERKERNKTEGKGFGFSVFKPESEYVNTISARYYKDGSEILVFQGDNIPPRKLTPRECARLQGFPEEFIIPVSNIQAYKQFGNSVAVPVIRAIANRMIEEMQNFSIK